MLDRICSESMKKKGQNGLLTAYLRSTSEEVENDEELDEAEYQAQKSQTWTTFTRC